MKSLDPCSVRKTEDKSRNVCEECNKTFSFSSSLRRHLREYHKQDKAKTPPQRQTLDPCSLGKTEDKSRNFCEECDKTFSSFSNLIRHMRNCHKLDKDKMKSLVTSSDKSYKFSCKSCKNNFSHFSHFKSHMNRYHKELVGNEHYFEHYRCALCADSFPKRDISTHYKETHDVVIKERRFFFTTIEDFYIWKEIFEIKTCSKFVQERHTEGHTHTEPSVEPHYFKRFKCHWTVGSDCRYLNKQGSSNMNVFCPATINLRINNDKYYVRVLQTHMGHCKDIEHLNLTDAERESLTSKVASNTQFDDILDEIRNSICDSNLDLLMKKEICNIESSYNMCNLSIKHSNDEIIDSWIVDMQSEGEAILFYKPQGSIMDDWPLLKEEDFMLIIMTKAQREMLKKHGSNYICIDAICGIIKNGFQLTTLLIVDNIQQGFPCSFLLSNRVDKDILSIFFHYVKIQTASAISPEVFMSSIMADDFFNAWLEIMSPPKSRLFCVWHVDQDWRKNLETKVKTREKQVEVYKKLRTILEQKNVTAFKIMHNIFYESLSQDADTAEFAQYFKDNYMSNTSWAYCHKLDSSLIVDMHLERMHRILMHVYMKGMNDNRLDESINAMMRFIRNRCIDDLGILSTEKFTEKLEIIISRHRTSILLGIDLVTACEDGWTVLSADKTKSYLVKKFKGICNCQFRCSDCKSCLQQYCCSCIDSSIRYNMCVHIHQVCMYLQKQDTSASPSITTDDVHEQNEEIYEISSDTDDQEVETDVPSKSTSNC